MPVFRNTILFSVFCLILVFPFFNSRTQLVKDLASTENRRMSACPPLHFNQLDTFPSKYETYYSDHFSLRSYLVKWYNQMKLSIFKQTPVPDKVVLGKNGWLFFVGQEHDSYLGKNRLTSAELEAFRQELEYRKAYLQARNCEFYVLVAPVKANIYPEEVPNDEFRASTQSTGEQLMEYLHANSNVKTIDVYQSLKSKKGNDPLYYKLDNHWNQLGAFHAANVVLDSMHEDFDELSANKLSDFSMTKKEIREGNLLEMLSNLWPTNDTYYDLCPKQGFQADYVHKIKYPMVKGFPYPDEFELEKELDEPDAPKLLVISDSFGGSIFPFLAEHFSRSVKIFDAWEYKLNEKIVASEKPDIVLLIILESGLRRMLKFSHQAQAHHPPVHARRAKDQIQFVN